MIGGAVQEKSGTLEYLAADLKAVLFTLSFAGLGIYRLHRPRLQSGAETVARVTASLDCEQILFRPRGQAGRRARSARSSTRHASGRTSASAASPRGGGRACRRRTARGRGGDRQRRDDDERQSGSSGIVSPGSRPSSTARVIAAEPKRARTSSSAASSAPPAWVERQRELARRSCSRFATRRRRASARAARSSASRPRAAPAPREDRRASRASDCGSVCERVAREKSAKRRRRTTVRPTRPAARMRRVTRSTRPTSAASTARASAASGRARAATPIEPRRRPGSTRRGSRLCASACSCRPTRGRAARRARLGDAATSPTVRSRTSELRAPSPGRHPRARSTGSGWRNASSPSGGTTRRPSGLATPLATLARNFVARDADRDRQPDLIAHVAAQPRRDLGRRAADALEAAHVEERLVDRQPLDERRRVLEDAEDRLAGVDVGREARRHDDRVRAQAARLSAAHRRPHAECLGLVARRQHDAGADDHGRPRRPGSSRCSTDAKKASTSACRIVRGRHEHMFARSGACVGRIAGGKGGRRVDRPLRPRARGNARAAQPEVGAARAGRAGVDDRGARLPDRGARGGGAARGDRPQRPRLRAAGAETPPGCVRRLRRAGGSAGASTPSR